jgi:hypothetical protein
VRLILCSTCLNYINLTDNHPMQSANGTAWSLRG